MHDDEIRRRRITQSDRDQVAMVHVVVDVVVIEIVASVHGPAADGRVVSKHRCRKAHGGNEDASDDFISGERHNSPAVGR